MTHAICRYLLAIFCVAALALQPPAVAEPQKGDKKAVKQPEPRIVKTILRMDVKQQDSEPPNLVVTVVGQVPTGGFTKPMLVRVIYAKPPEDGVQDYILFTVPPSGPATQALTEVHAVNVWNSYTREAPWFKGVRIHGVDRVLVKMWSEQP